MSSKTESAKLFALVMLLAMTVFPPCARAQAIDGNLTGTVVDPSGATIPNVTVEITNTRTGIKSSVKTGTDGLYRFNNLPVGLYNISVAATGFAVGGLKDVQVELNRTSTANVTMQVQGVTQQVTVIE